MPKSVRSPEVEAGGISLRAIVCVAGLGLMGSVLLFDILSADVTKSEQAADSGIRLQLPDFGTNSAGRSHTSATVDAGQADASRTAPARQRNAAGTSELQIRSRQMMSSGEPDPAPAPWVRKSTGFATHDQPVMTEASTTAGYGDSPRSPAGSPVHTPAFGLTIPQAGSVPRNASPADTASIAERTSSPFRTVSDGRELTDRAEPGLGVSEPANSRSSVLYLSGQQQIQHQVQQQSLPMQQNLLPEYTGITPSMVLQSYERSRVATSTGAIAAPGGQVVGSTAVYPDQITAADDTLDTEALLPPKPLQAEDTAESDSQVLLSVPESDVETVEADAAEDVQITAQVEGDQTQPRHPVPPPPVPRQPRTDAVVPNISPASPSDAPAGGSPTAIEPQRVVPQPSGTTTNSKVPRGHSVFSYAPGMSRFRATVESDAAPWMYGYSRRADHAASSTGVSVVIPAIPELGTNYVPWWDTAVRSETGLANSSMAVDISTLLTDAMLYSPQVLALQAEPEVQYWVVGQEAARFDWTTFLEATYSDLNDPVGNSLTLGTAAGDRLFTEKFNYAAGVRRKNLLGGELEISQKLGRERQNSSFFIPNPQGTARLELTYRQPLMDGAGTVYNRSQTVLAQIAANASEDEVVEALQQHLLKVTEAYWSLYRARAEFFQRQKLLQSSEQVLQILEARDQVDTIPRQILRAKAAVARSQSRIQRSLSRVRDAESQLRLLVNSPGMLNGGQTELLPTEPPSLVTENSALSDALHMALYNRPDISAAIRKMRAAGVRLGVSKKELLPRLDMIVTSYVADLEGSRGIDAAFADQFTDDQPAYTVGLEFEIPIGNRAARARHEQRKWELKRSMNVFRATVEKSLTDVEIAHREVATAYSEILSRYQAMTAARNEAEYLLDRFEVLPMAEDSATLLLEDLLDAQERLADEESAFVQAMSDHAIALVELRSQEGTLLRTRSALPELSGANRQWMTDRLDAAVREADSGQMPVSETASYPTGQSAGADSVSSYPTQPAPEQVTAGRSASVSPAGQSRVLQQAILQQTTPAQPVAAPVPQTVPQSATPGRYSAAPYQQPTGVYQQPVSGYQQPVPATRPAYQVNPMSSYRSGRYPGR